MAGLFIKILWEWGMGNGEWGMGNGEWGMANINPVGIRIIYQNSGG
ncbi:MAG: hypothetical protein JGK03_15370 [Microcoleus sp. PH2017_25_DOB_D_A]|nr:MULTISPECIES: hypothetical protein [unclassified Microcoleus]MCC3509501.1 hypothetical protein [Microcoleus sp. PH2017_17_BER_D_A]MCC3433929.1 hypothetical protein [Microcoleus sp. PH2017_05_CCC_O_A]MCC3499432.1 hypothetical protein [Microcoleus sp. PH2017_15_JOR_U_A]MCC3535552.1 hypothetical protein [Microcoleus sp. PH2017_25_DOB_D_A]MCC3545480.1 hypothetical protein [Microcoleus sp. PH2017_24_DOB_U_A]